MTCLGVAAFGGTSWAFTAQGAQAATSGSVAAAAIATEPVVPSTADRQFADQVRSRYSLPATALSDLFSLD